MNSGRVTAGPNCHVRDALGEQVGQGHGLVAVKAGQGDLRIECRLGLADVRVRGNQPLFRKPDVRAALKQRRGQTGGHFRADLLGRESLPALDRARVAAKQDAQGVLLLFAPALDVHDARLGAIDQDLRLGDILHGRDAAFLARGREDERVGADLVGAPGDFEFIVKLQQVEVSRGHLRDQRLAHGSLRVLCREQAGARGLVRATDLAPDIHLVGGHGREDVAVLALGFSPEGTGDGPFSEARLVTSRRLR